MDKVWRKIIIFIILAILITLAIYLMDNKVNLSSETEYGLPCGNYDHPRCTSEGEVRCDGNTYCKCENSNGKKFWKGIYICPEGTVCKEGSNGGCVPKPKSTDIFGFLEKEFSKVQSGS